MADLDKQFARRYLDGLPRLDGPLLTNAIRLSKGSKSCASDNVVAAMLSVMGEDIMESLADAFINGILNVESEFIRKAPKDSPHLVRYLYDNRPGRLGDFTMRSSGAKAPGVAPGPTCRPGATSGWSAGTT